METALAATEPYKIDNAILVFKEAPLPGNEGYGRTNVYVYSSKYSVNLKDSWNNPDNWRRIYTEDISPNYSVDALFPINGYYTLEEALEITNKPQFWHRGVSITFQQDNKYTSTYVYASALSPLNGWKNTANWVKIATEKDIIDNFQQTVLNIDNLHPLSVGEFYTLETAIVSSFDYARNNAIIVFKEAPSQGETGYGKTNAYIYSSKYAVDKGWKNPISWKRIIIESDERIFDNGVINLDVLFPLPGNEFYTIETAIKAAKKYQRDGAIIVFKEKPLPGNACNGRTDIYIYSSKYNIANGWENLDSWKRILTEDDTDAFKQVVINVDAAIPLPSGNFYNLLTAISATNNTRFRRKGAILSFCNQNRDTEIWAFNSDNPTIALWKNPSYWARITTATSDRIFNIDLLFPKAEPYDLKSAIDVVSKNENFHLRKLGTIILFTNKEGVLEVWKYNRTDSITPTYAGKVESWTPLITKNFGLKWLAFGDSLTFRPGSYVNDVASRLGANLYNVAIGGARMSGKEGRTPDNPYDYPTSYPNTPEDTYYDRNFIPQVFHVANTVRHKYNLISEEYRQSDGTYLLTPDLVTFGFGTNDVNGAKYVWETKAYADIREIPYDELVAGNISYFPNRLYRYLRYAFETLKRNIIWEEREIDGIMTKYGVDCRKSRMIFILPPQRPGFSFAPFADNQKWNLSQFKDLMQPILDDYSISSIDMFRNSGICERYEKIGQEGYFLADGVHPKDPEGNKICSDFVISQIKSLLNKY